jgi:heterodisulfide reductase subunit A
MAEKVSSNEELDSLVIPLTQRTLIIGGGIAGMQAALDIADAGYPVILVEKSDRLGERWLAFGYIFKF